MSEDSTEIITEIIQAASFLEHSNICTVYDIGETGDGKIYIVMASYDGRSLPSKR